MKKLILFMILSVMLLLCGCVDRKTPAEIWGEQFKQNVDNIDSYAEKLIEAHEKAEQD